MRDMAGCTWKLGWWREREKRRSRLDWFLSRRCLCQPRRYFVLPPTIDAGNRVFLSRGHVAEARDRATQGWSSRLMIAYLASKTNLFVPPTAPVRTRYVTDADSVWVRLCRRSGGAKDAGTSSWQQWLMSEQGRKLHACEEGRVEESHLAICRVRHGQVAPPSEPDCGLPLQMPDPIPRCYFGTL